MAKTNDYQIATVSGKYQSASGSHTALHPSKSQLNEEINSSSLTIDDDKVLHDALLHLEVYSARSGQRAAVDICAELEVALDPDRCNELSARERRLLVLFGQLYHQGHEGLPPHVIESPLSYEEHQSDLLEYQVAETDSPNIVSDILAQIFNLRPREIQMLLRILTHQFKDYLTVDGMVGSQSVGSEDVTDMSKPLTSKEIESAFNCIVESNWPSTAHQIGRKPLRVQRIWEVFCHNPNRTIPLKEFAAQFGDTTNANKNASNAISWINSEFRRLNISLEIDSIPLGNSRAYRFRRTSMTP